MKAQDPKQLRGVGAAFIALGVVFLGKSRQDG